MGYYDFITDEKKGYAGWDDKNTDKYCRPDECTKANPSYSADFFKDGVKELNELVDEYKYNEVNHPRHYTSGSVECIDAIESALGIEGAKNFCQGNAIKYLFRMQHKGATTQDCEKAIWYCNKWIELNKKEDE